MTQKRKRFAVEIHVPAGPVGVHEFDSLEEAREFAQDLAREGPGVVGVVDKHLNEIQEQILWNLKEADTELQNQSEKTPGPSVKLTVVRSDNSTS